MTEREQYLIRERDRVEQAIRSLTARLADVEDTGAIDVGADSARTANSQRLEQLQDYLKTVVDELEVYPVVEIYPTAMGTGTIFDDESEYDS